MTVNLYKLFEMATNKTKNVTENFFDKDFDQFLEMLDEDESIAEALDDISNNAKLLISNNVNIK